MDEIKINSSNNININSNTVQNISLVFNNGSRRLGIKTEFISYSKLIERSVNEAQQGLTKIEIRPPSWLFAEKDELNFILNFIENLCKLSQYQTVNKFSNNNVNLDDSGSNTNNTSQFARSNSSIRFGSSSSNIGTRFTEPLTKENKHKLYGTFSLHEKGELISSLVLWADYFEVVHDYLIRGIRHRLEKELKNKCKSIDSAREYFSIHSEKFTDSELKEIIQEEPFNERKFNNGDLYNSLADTKKHLDQIKLNTNQINNNNNNNDNNNNNKIYPDLHQFHSHSVIQAKEREIENKPADIVKSLLPRKSDFAVTEHESAHCHRCKSLISNYFLSFYYASRHHCRDCGLIFCSQCSNETVDSSEISKQRYRGYFEHFSAKKRVCIDCAKNIRDTVQHKDLVRTLEILSLKFKSLRKFSAVCPKWRKSSILYLSSIRMIQYGFPTHKFSPYEKKVLWRNRKWFKCHSIWLMKLLLSLDYQNMNHKKIEQFVEDYVISPGNGERTIDCYYLMCSSSCEKQVDPYQVVPLLDQQVTNRKVRSFAVKRLDELGEDILLILPQLVFLLRYEPAIVSDLSHFLFKKAKESSVVAYNLMWELKICQKSENFELRYEFLKSQLISYLSQNDNQYTQSLVLGFEFSQILQSHPIGDRPDLNHLNRLKQFERLEAKLKLPFNPLYSIESFNIENTTIKESATKPMILSCNCINDQTKEKKPVKLMFKKDDVRKDQMILNLITIMSRMLEKAGQSGSILPLTYRIQPTGTDFGFIEIVEKSTTLKDIYKKYDSKYIRSFLEEKSSSSNQNTEQRDEIFSLSLASWIIITHLLGVGDRHNENVMVTDNCQIFHIDYGYILGKEPKPISNYIRFDKDFEDVLTPIKKKNFQDACTRVFSILRKESSFFLYHLLFLTRYEPQIEGNFYEKYIEEVVASRFIPGFPESDDASYVHYLLESNLGSMTQSFVDFIRKKKIETTQTLNEMSGKMNFGISSVFYNLPKLWGPSNNDSS